MEITVKAIENSYFQITLNETENGYIVRHNVLGEDYKSSEVSDYKLANIIFETRLDELFGT